jgi:radical SAM protein with 4Fe4S-binding SPASM domain
LIDWELLDKKYHDDMAYALQLEFGDTCKQNCIYCYMNAVPDGDNTLGDGLVHDILIDCSRLGIRTIEWLGGEPLLRSSIFEHMSQACDLGLNNNIWTGGLPLRDKSISKKCVQYARDGLISVHVSTVDPKVYELLHPGSSSRDMYTILDSVKYILDMGYPADQMLNSVTYTGLQPADDMIATIDYFEDKFGIKTSLNVYHTYLRPGTPVGQLEKFVPTPKDVARVYRRYSRQYGGGQLPMNCVNKQYCSTTVAILCDGSVTPCATIREAGAPNVHRDGGFYDIFQQNRDYLIFKTMKDAQNLPQDCKGCNMNNICWGCRSRAFAAGRGIYGKDPRCFRSNRNDRIV